MWTCGVDREPSMLGTAFRFAFASGSLAWPWMTRGSFSSAGSSFAGMRVTTAR